MHSSAAAAYTLLVLGLYLKYVVLIAVQGTQRMRSRRFRWPEDAAAWVGEVGSEPERVDRAQAALRNDGESQPLFLAASAAWILLGAAPHSALALCALYVLTRWTHTFLLLVPRQPLRTRVFGLSQLCLLLVIVDLCRLAARAHSF
jgi:uncharacterized MAPEG superfamily protein